jgi:predicted nucleic acid-binding protein
VPNRGIAAWLSQADEDTIYVCTLTLTELRYGVERLAVGARRKRLEAWLRDGFQRRFEGRILPIDSAVADLCGTIIAAREKQGRPIALADALIAATAQAHELILVTRNVSDFKTSVARLLCPWTEA